MYLKDSTSKQIPTAVTVGADVWSACASQNTEI